MIPGFDFPLTRLFQILSVLHAFTLNQQNRVSDPTKLLPEGFHQPLNIREGRELFPNNGQNYQQNEISNGIDHNFKNAEDFPTHRKARKHFNKEKGWMQEPKVTLDVGEMEGYFIRVISGRKIYAFEGVPYAEPPVGENRFRAPVEKKRWSGVLQAKSWPPMCAQARTRHPILHGQEDCLYLNVYTPKLPHEGGKRLDLPILLFIHGGAFVTGSSTEYGPSYLMQQDIVLITINYRLGVFGFLSTGSPTCSGNWGLKDQAMAIDWAHKYGEKFGGDPKRLVLIGQSAGAVSVHLHLMSPLIKHKIFGAIALSGTAFMTWALRESTEEINLARRLAALNMCPWSMDTENSEEEALDCLRSRSTANLTVSSAFIMIAESKVFIPVIEPYSPSAFVTKSPTEYYNDGEVAPVPFITTMTSREFEITLALKLTQIESLPQFQFFGPSILVAFAPVLLDYQDKESNYSVPEITRRVFNYYGGEQVIQTEGRVLAQIATDRHFSLGLRRAIRRHMKIAKTYAYYFSYNSDIGFADKLTLNPNEFGVPHGEDVLFLFNRTDWKPIGRRQGHFAIVKLMQALFYNFAKSGEPLYTDEKFVDYKIWKELKTDSPVRFLQIDKDVRMMTIPEFQNATDFWESLGIEDV